MLCEKLKVDRIELNAAAHIACAVENFEVIKYLHLVLKYDFSVPDAFGKYPLHTLCAKGNLLLVAYLCEGVGDGVDLLARDRSGMTPFSLVCHSQSDTAVNVVKYLHRRSQKLGVEPEMLLSADSRGYSPFHLACDAGNFDIVQYLREHCGVDIDRQTKGYGLKGIHIARTKKHAKIVDYLSQDIADYSSSHDVPKKVVKKDADVAAQRREQEMPWWFWPLIFGVCAILLSFVM